MKRPPFVLKPFMRYCYGYRNGDEARKNGKSRQERNSEDKKLMLPLLLSLPQLPALTENNTTNFRTTTRGGHIHHTTRLPWSTHPHREKKEKRPQECRFCDPVHRVCQETTTVPSEGAPASSGIAMVVVVAVMQSCRRRVLGALPHPLSEACHDAQTGSW